MAAFSIIVGSAATLAVFGYLIWRGFHDGDAGDDIVVQAHRIPRPDGSVTVEVVIGNPGPAAALVALALRPAWRPHWMTAPASAERRTVLRPSRLSLVHRTVGALGPGESADFRLTARRGRRALRLELTVGSTGRLRRHRLDVASPGAWGGGPDTADMLAGRLAGLASLDEDSVPPEPVLLAEVDGELWAALSLSTHSHVADPFRPSGELLDLLRHRAQQLCPAPSATRRRRVLFGVRTRRQGEAPAAGAVRR